MTRLLHSRAGAAPAAALALVVAIGAALRLVVAGQDLFADELASYWVVSAHGLEGVLQTVRGNAEITPPLSFVLSWLATRIDLTPELLRLPALIGGVASIPLVYAIGARAVGRGAGLIAATITALSPFMIYYSAEARGYGLMVGLVLLSTVSLLKAVEAEGRRWWVLYAVSVCAAAYTHYTSIFVLAAQLIWVLWAHPRARVAALVATAAAAVGFAPWLPGLTADLDSPTTRILSDLSPFNLDAVGVGLGHWMVGFPYANIAPLDEMPGTVALLLLLAAGALGLIGAFTARARAPRRDDPDRRLALIVALAFATPTGTALASLLGSNVFGTRNLAASWPYLALAFAALVCGLKPPLRFVAAALAVIAFALGAAKMPTTDFQRPNFEQVAGFVENGPRGVLVDGASFTPGPSANSDVSVDPAIPVIRLGFPEVRDRPFIRADEPASPDVVARRAVAVAAGGPITLVTIGNPVTAPSQRGQPPSLLIEALPRSYELVEQRTFRGMFNLHAYVFERRVGSG